MKQALALLGLLAAASCSAPSSPPTAAPPAAAAPGQPTAAAVQQAVATYIKAEATAFADYEPVRWGRPVAYTKMSEAAIKGVATMQLFDNALATRNRALAAYKAALARHDAPAKLAALKARYDQANKRNNSLLALATSLSGVRDSTRLGTTIGHTYRTRAKSGIMRLDSATFVVYASGHVEQL